MQSIFYPNILTTGDGGIHGQLLKNNGFQGDDPTLDPYAAIGGAALAIDSASPLTTAITKTLKVSGGTGQVGFSNSGYNGVAVNQVIFLSLWLY